MTHFLFEFQEVVSVVSSQTCCFCKASVHDPSACYYATVSCPPPIFPTTTDFYRLALVNKGILSSGTGAEMHFNIKLTTSLTLKGSD